MMVGRVVGLAAIVALVTGHPAGLECGTDTTTRLRLGATVMDGPVTDGSVSDDGLDVEFRLGRPGTPSEIYVRVDKTVASAMYFAARITGPGEVKVVKGNPYLVLTKNCTKQVFTNTTSRYGVYAFQAQGATAESKVHVGYSSTGPKGIALVSAPAKPAVAQE
mmetsp:Transcript_126354/g.178347  ORF Transcript_126354/g.178347 Transcript_126354/m.178347 type:complete len:163 (+) Transcript_126354:21-509(+)